MNDDELDAVLAAERSRVPPQPATAAMWRRIETRRLMPVATRRGPPRWIVVTAAMAASLVIGVCLGRTTVPDDVDVTAAALPNPASALTAGGAELDPYRRTIEELLGRTAVLLATLPRDPSPTDGDAALADQGAQLLGTVRLLLDSPVGADERMSTLLGDLELVLVQVARLQGASPNDEYVLIHDAMSERDIVPRIRSAVVDYSLRLN